MWVGNLAAWDMVADTKVRLILDMQKTMTIVDG
jgi:hypothetical protein